MYDLVYGPASQQGLWLQNFFSCSTLLRMKFQTVIKTKMLKMKTFLAFKLSEVVFIMHIDVK